MIRLLVTLMFLMGVVLYPEVVRSQAPYSTPAAPDRYCAKPVGALEPPDCSFSNMKDCRASLKARAVGVAISNSAEPEIWAEAKEEVMKKQPWVRQFITSQV